MATLEDAAKALEKRAREVRYEAYMSGLVKAERLHRDADIWEEAARMVKACAKP